MSDKRVKVKKEPKVKKRKTNRLFTRDQLFIFIILLVIIAAVVVGSILLGKNNKNNNENNNQNQNNQEQNNNNENNNNTLIDMENKENVEIKDGEKINNSQKLKEEKQFAGMKVKEINLYTRAEGMTDFNATVENTSGKDFKSQKILIKFFNKDGSEYAILKAYLGDVKTGATAKIDASTTADVSNAYNFEILEDKD
ncbi:MAG: FxLYD domain-containing protein [Clostridia bacterium]|nr:FxLYD domain-containing protein [Clostridia bacterium]